MNCANQRDKITAEQYLQMLKNDELEGDLTAIFGRLRNTEQFWKKPRNDVNCMTQNYGPATWFLTMSPSEWMWEDLGEYIRQVNGVEMANKTVSELLALDHVSTSRFIDNKFQAMLDLITSSDEPLGKIIHYFWHREYQSRGAQYFHLMLWVKDASILHKSSIDEESDMINDYNPALLLALNGNIDIQYVGEKTAILNYYVTKYTTKSEKTNATDMFNDINSTKSLRSRLYNIGLRVLSNRECGALEASDTLLGIPLYGTDPQTTIRWLDVNIHRNRRVKSKSEMTALDPNSTDIYYDSWIDNVYPARPD
ncbi:unnamed protein product [Parnassius apollo]|uniref:(apollo) hypothetical protein n=1 Tax=Parnassius apollo TaxID=110799 RepID=A0A8S3XY43_PARAO|nr:unnamed protein product [Parnassius apollo]